MGTSLKDRRYFTTGQVAKLCSVASRTAAKWFDSGKLRGYRIPGSLDRRIPRECLVAFLKENGLPVPADLAAAAVLLVGPGHDVLAPLQAAVMADGSADFRTAFGGFEAGTWSESIIPTVIVIDLAMGRSEALSIAEKLRNRHEHAAIIALANEDETNEAYLTATHFDQSFKRPFDPMLLVESVRSLLARKES